MSFKFARGKKSYKKKVHGIIKKMVVFFFKETHWLFTSYKGFQFSPWKKTLQKKIMVYGLFKIIVFFVMKHFGFSLRTRVSKNPPKIIVFFVVAGGYVAGQRWLGGWWLATTY